MNYSINNHCPNCFHPSLQPICACGCNRSDYLHVNRALPLFTTLDGGYVLGRVIDSSGSFGMVYTAIHQDAPDIALAIKEYYPNQLAERVGQTIKPNTLRAKVYQDYLQRFEQEAQLLFKCQRYPFVPGIVRGSDLIHQHGTAYLVMERLFGCTLESLLGTPEQPKILTLEQIIGWLKPLLENLAALHNRNIYHRDLKPANIFLRDVPDCLAMPVIMDFGIAREGELETLIQSSVIGSGSRCYRAPEMVKQGLKYGITARTDIYSIGAILFHCLYGEPPLDVERRLSGERLNNPRQISEPKLHTIVLECLELERDNRPKTAQALLQKLSFLWQRYETIVPMNAEVKKANDRIAELETGQTELETNNKALQQKVDQLGVYWQKRLQESEAQLAHLSVDRESLQQKLSAKMTASPPKDWQSSQPKSRRFLIGLNVN